MVRAQTFHMPKGASPTETDIVPFSFDTTPFPSDGTEGFATFAFGGNLRLLSVAAVRLQGANITRTASIQLLLVEGAVSLTNTRAGTRAVLGQLEGGEALQGHILGGNGSFPVNPSRTLMLHVRGNTVTGLTFRIAGLVKAEDGGPVSWTPAQERFRTSLIRDPLVPEQIAEVLTAAPGGADAGLVVRPIGQISLEAANVSHVDSDAAIAQSPVATGTTTPLRFRSRLYGVNESSQWDRIRAGMASDGLAPTGFLTNQPMLFNPVTSSYDRQRAPYQRLAGWLSIYSYSLRDAPGVAAANRFLSLFNPLASGRTLILLGVKVETYSVAIAVARNSLRLVRTTAASVGTLRAAADINKWVTADPNAVAEVRTANPTITAAAEVDAFGPNENVTAAGTTGVSRRECNPDPLWGEFRLPSGEGVALDQTIAGDVDQTHDLKIIWAER